MRAVPLTDCVEGFAAYPSVPPCSAPQPVIGIIPIILTIFSRSLAFIIELDGCKSLIARDGTTLSLNIIFSYNPDRLMETSNDQKPGSSASALHKQWAKLEDEHHELAIAIDAARTKKTEVAQMRERQQSLLLEITSLVGKIQNAPATTIEDFLALLDVSLEHELDLACEMAFYGPADYPIITRLVRVLAHEIRGSNLTLFAGGCHFRANPNS